MFFRRVAVGSCLLLALVVPLGAGEEGTYTLRGMISGLDDRERLSARLYSPKSSMAQQARIPDVKFVFSYVTAEGKFEFPGLRENRYLLEIYRAERLLHQQVLDIPKLTWSQESDGFSMALQLVGPSEISGWLQEKHWVSLQGIGLPEDVVLHVEDIHKDRPYYVTLIQLKPEDRSLLKDSKVSRDAFGRIAKRSFVLLKARVRGGEFTKRFSVSGKAFLLKGTPVNGDPDYLDYQVASSP